MCESAVSRSRSLLLVNQETVISAVKEDLERCSLPHTLVGEQGKREIISPRNPNERRKTAFSSF